MKYKAWFHPRCTRGLWQPQLPVSWVMRCYQKGRLSQQLINWRGDISIAFCASVSPVHQLSLGKTCPSETSSSVLLSAACSRFCSRSFKLPEKRNPAGVGEKNRRWSLQVLHSVVKLIQALFRFTPSPTLTWDSLSELSSLWILKEKKRSIFQNLVLDLIQYSNYLAFTFSKKNAHYKEHTRHYLSLPHISALWLTANKSSWFVSEANANMGRWWEGDE